MKRHIHLAAVAALTSVLSIDAPAQSLVIKGAIF